MSFWRIFERDLLARKVMKIGLQTIAWNDSPIETVIREASSAGFAGVEIAQSISDDQFEKVYHSLQTDKVQLAGLSGGDMQQRLRFAAFLRSKQPSIELPYIYADDWGAEEDAVYQEANVPCKIAIHPHMFKPIQTEADATSVLSQFPYTTFMPDTAHLEVAGESPVDVIFKNSKRLIAVHLKDWSPEYGRSLPFYSKGFTELGNGIVPLKNILSSLQKARFPGWLIVEQDYALCPENAARKSLAFLKKVLGVRS